MPSKIIGIRVDDELAQKIKTRAGELGITASALCWEIVRRAMQSKRKVNAPPRPTGLAAMSPEVARRVKSLGGRARKKS